MAEDVRLMLNDVDVQPSAMRQTPNRSFGTYIRSGLTTAGRVAGNTVNAAGYYMPSVGILSAAVGGVAPGIGIGGPTYAGGATSAGGGSVGMYAGGAGLGTAGGVGNYSAGYTAGSGSVGGGTSDFVTSIGSGSSAASSNNLLSATQQLQEMSQTFNLQYLNLQQNMQNENREYSAVSNIMKTKHDTAKNALSNLK